MFDNWKRNNKNTKKAPKSDLDSEEYIVYDEEEDPEEQYDFGGEFSEGDLLFDQDGPEDGSSEEITEE